jgi:LysM repeat protein
MYCPWPASQGDCQTTVTSFSTLTNWDSLSEGDTFTLYLKDTDASENTGTAQTANLTKADESAPIRSAGSHSGELVSTTTNTTLSLTTDEDSTCKYATAANNTYAEMSDTLETTDNITHTKTISSLTPGTSYTYYVRCQDTATNTNDTDYLISFSVAAENTEEEEDFEEEDIAINHIQATTTETTLTLTWQTDHKTKSTVRYGTNKDLKNKQKDNTKEKKHKLTLDNLIPDTRYYFRIKSEDGDSHADRSKIHSIKTKATANKTVAQRVETVSANTGSLPTNTNVSDSSPNTCTYTIAAGDTLWGIAKQVYGDATAYTQIIELNKTKYPNLESNLKIGWELTFCESKQENSSKSNDQNNSNTSENTPQPKTFHWWNPWSWF